MWQNKAKEIRKYCTQTDIFAWLFLCQTISVSIIIRTKCIYVCIGELFAMFAVEVNRKNGKAI